MSCQISKGRRGGLDLLFSCIHLTVADISIPIGVECIMIAKPKGEASNRDALSSPVCIYVCMYVYVYICISVPVNPRHLDCAIARCSPQALTTTKCSTWSPSATKLLNTPHYKGLQGTHIKIRIPLLRL